MAATHITHDMDNKNITRHSNTTAYAEISQKEKMILQVYINLLQIYIKKWVKNLSLFNLLTE